MQDIQAFRQKFKIDANDNKDGNAYVAIVTKDPNGKLGYTDLGRGPCHGALQQTNLQKNLRNVSAEYILSSVQTLLFSKESSLTYIDWLANKSPWKDVFITKDAEDIFKYGWVAQTDLPANFVANAMIATRFITESYTNVVSDRFLVYQDILALGFSEEVSFLFSYLFNRVRTTKAFPITFVRMSSGHAALGLDTATESYFRNFLEHTPKGGVDVSFRDGKGYIDHVLKSWKTPSVGESPAFTNWIKGLRPKSAKDKINLNIFHKVRTDGFEIANGEDLKNIIEQALERIYHA